MSTERRKPYPFDEIEPRWQAHWEAAKTFRALNPGDEGFDPSCPKYYVLDMFPYPSGSGLHVGHPEGYTATDILARYKRMRGFNVLHPMGWDAFGLPAEQHAIKTGQHPAVNTAENVGRFKKQLQRIGFAYDWDREVNTTDPEYFKWTQWIFVKLYGSWFNPSTQRAEPISTYSGENPDEVRLAFVSEAPVNWCPALGTVLANEEVIDGKSEVGGFPVERRPLRQWMLRITTYAQRLIDELHGLDWPEAIKLHQRNWIGRSEGAEVDFAIESTGGAERKIRVFTTRPDTLFGVTYMVLAPEHPLLEAITAPECVEAVAAYQRQAAGKSDLDRTALAKEKTGVFTGAYASNPVTGGRIPIWISDYVLMGYGTGAIMAVPGHDERDFAFARAFGLPVLQVVQPPDGVDWQGYTGEGTVLNSEGSELSLNGMGTREARSRVTEWLREKGLGMARVNYKLRDWLFSRQRYWGEPFPIVWEGGEHRAVSEDELPVTPPEMEDFKPTGTPEPPLSKAVSWLQYSATARRELNTMPQWAGSCWYYLRYMDARNGGRFAGEEAERYWSGGGALPGAVDLYVGGTEHAVLHLLYARFWHKVLFDLGYVSTPEPFQKLVNQGLILGETEFTLFQMEDGTPVSAAELEGIEEEATVAGSRLTGRRKGTGERVGSVRIGIEQAEKKGDGFILKGSDGVRLDARSFKMSKSRGNVVNPDDVIYEYGADALRCYEMFMGPLEQTKPWSMAGVEGVMRFLARVWRLVMEENQEGAWVLSSSVIDGPVPKALGKVLHQTIKKVGEDIEALRFNTAISQMMICTNALTESRPRSAEAIRVLVQLLNPFAPHLTEELWQRLGGVGELATRPWPMFDPAALVEDEIEIPVQVNGKLRDKVTVRRELAGAELEALALGLPRIQEHLAGVTVRKIVVVPGKLVNIVAN